MANELLIISGTNQQMDLASSQTSEEVAQCLAAKVDHLLEDHNRVNRYYSRGAHAGEVAWGSL